MTDVNIQRVVWDRFHDHLSILLSSRQTRGLHLSMVEFLIWSFQCDTFNLSMPASEQRTDLISSYDADFSAP
jgi:hypothetical protein